MVLLSAVLLLKREVFMEALNRKVFMKFFMEVLKRKVVVEALNREIVMEVA